MIDHATFERAKMREYHRAEISKHTMSTARELRDGPTVTTPRPTFGQNLAALWRKVARQ